MVSSVGLKRRKSSEASWLEVIAAEYAFGRSDRARVTTLALKLFHLGKQRLDLFGGENTASLRNIKVIVSRYIIGDLERKFRFLGIFVPLKIFCS